MRIDKLTEEQKQIMKQAYLDGKTCAQVGALFGIKAASCLRFLINEGIYVKRKYIRNIGPKVKRFFIYGLYDDNGELRYIGQTTRSLKQRFSVHLCESRGFRKNQHCAVWIRSMLKENTEPTIQLIQELYNKDDLNGAEQYWIKYLRDQGCRLVNHSDGGEGCVGFRHTEETKKKMALLSKGRRRTEEMKIKRRKYSPEVELEICQKYKEGLSTLKLGALFGLSNSGVCKILHRNNVILRNCNDESYNAISLDNHDYIISQYSLGKSCSEIGKHFNVDKSHIRHLLQRKNIKIRTSAEQLILDRSKSFKDQFGNTYRTQGEAASKLNLNQSCIGRVLNKLARSTGGYVFEYLKEPNAS